MVTSDTVEQACNEVSSYTEQQMAAEFERFFRSQPDLCDFIVDLTTDSGQQIQELSLFLSYMVFKAVETAQPAKVEAISQGRIEEAFKQSEAWIERVNHTSGEPGSAVMSSLASDAEPHLLQYVISELNQPLEDGTSLADEQKGEVFFVLKTVISSLSGSPFEKQETKQ